jgi:uncharacterized Fe-S cluster-containing radical SAM superfamily enzyme
MRNPFACIDRIYSVSAAIGGPKCNANCPGCAGRAIRSAAAAVEDYNKAPRNIVAASRLCVNYGGWSLALTSAGEPTLYPDAITDTLKTLKENGVQWPFINLFTNGIRLANDGHIQDMLPYWRELGLTSVALSVHNIDDEKNAAAYGLSLDRFYKLRDALEVIKRADLCPRIVLLLGKGNVDNAKEYKRALDYLHDIGVTIVTSWELRNNDGTRCEQTPRRRDMFGIKLWLLARTQAVMGHIWGGMVRSYKGMNVRLTDYVSEHHPWNDYIRQLVLLPGGRVSYSWYQEGMFCLD